MNNGRSVANDRQSPGPAEFFAVSIQVPECTERDKAQYIFNNTYISNLKPAINRRDIVGCGTMFLHD